MGWRRPNTYAVSILLIPFLQFILSSLLSLFWATRVTDVFTLQAAQNPDSELVVGLNPTSPPDTPIPTILQIVVTRSLFSQVGN